MSESAATVRATQLIQRVTVGDVDAHGELCELLYDDLRQQAGRLFRRERAGHSLTPTVLVHEAYMRLVDARSIDVQGRTHFRAIAGRVMRQVLIDHARGKSRKKHGAGWNRITLTDQMASYEVDPLIMDEALELLRKKNPRHAEVFEMRCIAGLTTDEIATELGVSDRTIRDDWRFARAWLRSFLSDGDEKPEKQ